MLRLAEHSPRKKDYITVHTLWKMGEQEKVIHGFTYIMQRKILWNNVGKTVSRYNTNFSVLYLSTFKCQILKYLYIHIQRKI
jgi:hypothetical protein